ncbi:dimethylarginine dimethylaminohydrolase family protein [Acidaminobacter hydrogenoformans]|uniref:N-Dimethylarginine dimethylaminohydrolase n=1 Tax=Acidaminobacter hydrogenoformans DSM 2784 TaxID=1120920 RepID=A0A1G5S714_9FIRM|nr:arginine deiminase family protein [Acidaminobacter hydrogenoformans]SCZ81369.1 N-Dimethylarginine dimethylaminohydrolase [Acidaminobacter hydrogenoformans DSM 2784]
MHYGSQSMTGKLKTVLIKHPEAAFKNQNTLNADYEAFGYIGAPEYEIVLKEYAAFEAALKAEGTELLYLPEEASVGLDSIYAHDPLKVTKKGAIYFPMGKALRSKEAAATRSFLEANGIPTLGVIEAPAMIEGGDIVWLDERTVAIGRGYRTNDAGIEAFRKLTEGMVDEIIVIPMPHADGPDACLHLMSIISMVDQDLAVVYSKYMPVFFRELLLKRGMTLIETPDAEYDYLGTNVLAIAPRVAIMVEGNDAVKKGLEANGAKVYTYLGKEVSYRGTGGPTCLTAPIWRA